MDEADQDMSRAPSSLGQQINSSVLVVMVPAPHPRGAGPVFRSELAILVCTRLPEFYRFFLHAALQRLGFGNSDLPCIIAHVPGDFYGAEVNRIKVILFHRHRLREIARLVHIGAPLQRHRPNQTTTTVSL